MPSFHFSARAARDMADIATYTLSTWGVSQMTKYLSVIEQCASLLASNPRLGRACVQIRPGLYRFEKKRNTNIFNSSLFTKSSPSGARQETRRNSIALAANVCKGDVIGNGSKPVGLIANRQPDGWLEANAGLAMWDRFSVCVSVPSSRSDTFAHQQIYDRTKLLKIHLRACIISLSPLAYYQSTPH